MDKQATNRRARVAVSAFFGLLTVALCVLWVRSYWRRDAVLRIYQNDRFDLGSHRGQIYVALTRTLPNQEELRRPVWRYQSWPADMHLMTWHRASQSAVAWTPHWCLAVLFACGGLAAIFCPTWKFSLRQLVIATTLVAVVLGLGVWLVRT